MRIETTTASLIARSLRNRLSRKSRPVHFGLFVRNMPDFDLQKLYDECAPDIQCEHPTFRLALIGFNGDYGSHSATTVEQTVEWRNDPTITIPLIVILNPQHPQEKVHSLELLEPFEDTDLQRAICAFGEQESDAQHTTRLAQLWNVLQHKNLGIPLVAAQLAAFYDAMQHDQCPPGDALVHLGLFKDPSLFDKGTDKEKLKKRLQNNYKRVRDLLTLDKKDYRSLAAALRKNESLQRTFLALRAYTQKPSTKNLEELTYDDVEKLWNVRDISVNQTPKQLTDKEKDKKDKLRGSIHAQDDILITNLFDGQYLDQEPEFQELIEREFEGVREKQQDFEGVRESPGEYTTSSTDDTPYVVFSKDERELQERHPDRQEEEERHPLENWMRKWVEPDVWGGIVKPHDETEGTKQKVSVRELLEKAANLTFTPFQPIETKHSLEEQERVSLITLLNALDEVIPPTEGEDILADLFATLHKQRSQLAPYKISLLYYPFHAIALQEKRNLLAGYINTYEKLSRRFQSVYTQASTQFPDTIEQALAQFLALDTIIIDRLDDEAALLTSLHPLHVWKWHELAQRIQQRQDNSEMLNDNEKEILLSYAKQLPTLLNTLLLHKDMLLHPRHLDPTFLVVSDTMQAKSDAATMGIPVYQTIAKQMLTHNNLGHEQVQKLLQYFLSFYPPARIGLVLALIDPPSLKPFLNACLRLYEDGILYGCSMHIYRTNDQGETQDVWSLRDEGIWNLFQDNPYWTFYVDITHSTYQDIAKDIQKRRKQHIIILCDPSDSIALPTVRPLHTLPSPSPFGVPMRVTYDKIRDSVRITATADGGIFEAYTHVRNSLTGEQNRRTIGVGNKPAISKADLEALAKQSYWLIVIDHLYSTLEMPPIGNRIAWEAIGHHALSVWTQDEQRWQEYFKDLDISFLDDYLDDMLTIFPDGLLATLTNPDPDETKATRQQPQEHSISRIHAVVTTLQWYRQRYESAVLLNIDPRHTPQFTDWFGELELPKKNNTETYLLAVYEQDGVLHFDVIAVQAYDSTLEQLPALRSPNNIKLLEAFAQTLDTLFASDAQEALLAPIRQELLRVTLSAAVFTPPVTKYNGKQEKKKENKAKWEDIINDLFTNERPATKIQLRHMLVAMQSSGEDAHIQSLSSEHYNAAIVKLPGMLYSTVERDDPSDKLPTQDTSLSDTNIPDIPLQSTPQTVQQQPDKPGETTVSETDETQTTALSEDISKQAGKLRRVLMEYGIAVSHVDEERSQVGPSIIRYWVKLQPPAGRLAEVQKYAEDIARELECKSVPLIENIPGERYIGIDLARTHPKIEHLTPALQQLPPNQTDTLMIAMGVDIAGQAIQKDLVRLPHMLVAGTTGSGKTMFLSTLIMSLVWQHSRQELELLLIDPKETDFILFQQLPHLREGRVFYDATDAIDALQRLTGDERDRRKSLLQTAHCPNILEYNRRNPQQRLSWIVIVIDEFADIMNTLSRNERTAFEKQIGRLAATGRSIGIHLVLATQRPTTDIVTGTLKANIPARVSFRLPSSIDSRTILDRSGAERLLGQGDMLALFESDLLRLQGYYAPFDELELLLGSLPTK